MDLNAVAHSWRGKRSLENPCIVRVASEIAIGAGSPDCARRGFIERQKVSIFLLMLLLLLWRVEVCSYFNDFLKVQLSIPCSCFDCIMHKNDYALAHFHRRLDDNAHYLERTGFPRSRDCNPLSRRGRKAVGVVVLVGPGK